MGRYFQKFMNRMFFATMIILLTNIFQTHAQNAVNLAYSAVFSHSGGGVSFYGYGPENYNDSVICSGATTCYGWVGTASNPDPNAWIDIDWGNSFKKFDQITIYLNNNTNRALSGATLQYWNGSTFVDFYTYNLSTIATLSYTINFTAIVANKIRLTNLYYIGTNGNPSIEEIEVRYSRMYKNDAGITAISSPASRITPGTYNVAAVLQNMGTDTLKSAGLRWTVDGSAQTSPSNWSGALANLQKDNNKQLGSYNFTTGIRKIKSWTVSPNGQTDSNPYNDTNETRLFVCTPLSGTYVVDAAGSGDFRTFNEALSWVSGCGLGGPVTIRVKPGYYTEQLTITNISGLSKSNTLTFESYNLDSTSVNLNYSAKTDVENWVVLLSGVRHITIRNITIQATGNNYGCVVNIADASDSNTIANNIIKTSVMTNTYFSGILFSSWVNGNTLDEYNIIRNNIISGGYLGIWMFGPNNSIMAKGNVIEKNIIKDFYYYGLYLVYQDSMRVIGNQLENSPTSTGALGIYSLYSNKMNISQNQIRLNGSSTMYGIYSYYSNNGTTLPYTQIYNNFISLGSNGSSQCIGLYSYYSSYMNYYYNTVNIYNSTTSSYNFYCYNGTTGTTKLLNNIFTNNSGGYAMYLNTSGLLGSSDYNLLYTTGTTLVYMAGNYASLAAWKTASNMDKYSISSNIQYYSQKDLHLNSSVVNGSGTTVSGINNDIDGESRTSTPDIGADEFKLLQIDAGVSDINSPVSPCPGSNAVSAKIKNYGTSVLSSVTVNWSVNGVTQTAATASISLLQYQETTVSLGSYSFSSGNIYKIKFWTSQPNSSNDSNSRNDTFFYIISRTAMYGTYTIGTTGSDYTTIRSAVDDLVLRGICNPVVFRMKPGTYNEKVYIPSIPGSSASNTITFESYNLDSNSVDIYYTAAGTNDNYVIGLFGADYITFRYLKIRATGQNYGRAVFLTASANNCRFLNNIISTMPAASSSNHSCIYSDATKDDYTEIRNNKLSGGYYGIYLYGPSTSSRELNSIVKGNIITDFYYYGILVYYNSSPDISNNYIEPSSLAASTVYGIYGYYNNDTLKITKNNINISCPSSSYGMYLYYCQSTAALSGLVANNFVSLNGTTTATSYGINEYYCNYVSFYNNSIHLSNTITGSSYAFYCSYGTGLNVVNNIFSNQGGGQAYYVASTATLTTTNYNDLYSTGTVLGYWNGNRANLAAWKTAASPNEANSISANPYFYSNKDLHVYSKSLDSAGLVINIVKDDIDNQTRHASRPDIGADEFTVSNIDASVISLVSPIYPCPGTKQNISVRLRNFGLNRITSTKIKWSLNGTLKTPYNFSGNLANLKDTVLILGSDTFYKNINYEIKAWIDTVNGVADQNNKNDTLIVKNFHTSLTGNYTIGASGRDYPNFTSAVNDLIGSGICDHVIFDVDPGTYNEHISIPPIQGASSTKTITFRSANGDSTSVIMNYNATGTGDNYLVLLNGADFIRFERITLRSGSNNGYGCIVELRNAANNNIFKGNRLLYTGPASGSAYGIYSSNSYTSSSYNLFEWNDIQNGYYGIYWYGYSSSQRSIGNKIRNNLISGFYYYGTNLYYHDSLDLSKNKLTGGNIAAYGNYCYYISNSSLNSNQVYLNSSNAMYGFYLYQCVGNASASLMLNNNMISLYGTTTQNVFGIYSSYCYNNKYYHNTVNITCGSTTGSSGMYFTCPSTGTYGNIEVQNNIVVNTGGGYALYIDPGAVTKGYIYRSNFNDLFVSGTYIGHYGTVDVPQLKNWQAIPLDQKSINILPSFISSTNLHLSSFYGMAVQNNLNIAKDIDEETRSATKPVAGADENPHLAIDAGIRVIVSPQKVSCDGVQNVSAYLYNFGLNKLDSVIVEYYLNGLLQRSLKYKGALNYLNNTLINLGNDTFTAGISTIKIKTRQPNGKDSADTFTFNDADSIDVRFVAFPVISSVQGDTVCMGDSATLHVYSPNTKIFSWYHTATSDTVLSTDSVFNTPLLSKTDTFYVDASTGGNPATITTTNATSAAPEMGNMFDIKAINTDLVIDSFAIHLTSSTLGQFVPVEVYYRNGTYAGYETNASAWTLLGVDTVISNGYLSLTDISPGGVKIKKNETFGFYITTTDPNYVLHNTIGAKVFSDAYIQLSTGTKTFYPFDATYSQNSTWNGKVYYGTGSLCRSNRMAVVAKVYDIPDVKLGPDVAFCKGNSVVLDAGYAPNFTYDWKYGSSNTTIATTNSITVDSAGSYRVIVSNNCGNKSSDTINVTVRPLPKAGFSVNQADQCLKNNSFIFTDQSTISSGIISGYNWNFGDGQTATGANTSHAYAAADTFKVSMVATSQYNCTDTAFSQIIVHPQPKAVMDINSTSQCLGGNLFNFDDQSTVLTGSINSHDWNFGDNIQSSLKNPSHIYLVNGLFNVKLTTYTDKGCFESINKLVTVYPQPGAAFSINDSIQCFSGNEFVMTNLTPAYPKYLWNFGDAVSDTNKNTKHSYPSSGNFQVKLRTTNSHGCKDSLVKVVVVNPQPVVNLGNDTTIRGYQSLILSAGSNIDSSRWSTGATTNSITVDSAHFGLGLKIIHVKVYKNGCLSADTISVTIKSSVGIDIKEGNTQISVYPNPVNEKLTVTMNGLNKSAEIELTDLLGHSVWRGKMEGNKSINTVEIDMQPYAKGAYLLKIVNDGKITVVKVVRN